MYVVMLVKCQEGHLQLNLLRKLNFFTFCNNYRQKADWLMLCSLFV